MKCKGKPCSVTGCGLPAEKLMLCRNHYATADRADLGACSVEGCSNKEAFGRRGLCNKHYIAQYRRTNPKLCSLCARPSIAKGMCAAHYSRAKRGYDQSKPLAPRYNGRLCSQLGCERVAKGRGLCRPHYARLREGIPLDRPIKGSLPPRPFVNSYGYVGVPCADGKNRMQHRLIMAELLGRELLKSETVHHKNGMRADNRLKRGHELGGCPSTCCNLDLWSHMQPKGQRVADKVTWAREILRLYGAMFPEEPRRKPEQLRLVEG